MLRSPTISKAFGYPASLVLAVDRSVDLTEWTLGRDAVQWNRRGSENYVGETQSRCGRTMRRHLSGASPPDSLTIRHRLSDKPAPLRAARTCVSNWSVNRQQFVR